MIRACSAPHFTAPATANTTRLWAYTFWATCLSCAPTCPTCFSRSVASYSFRIRRHVFFYDLFYSYTVLNIYSELIYFKPRNPSLFGLRVPFPFNKKFRGAPRAIVCFYLFSIQLEVVCNLYSLVIYIVILHFVRLLVLNPNIFTKIVYPYLFVSYKTFTESWSEIKKKKYFFKKF